MERLKVALLRMDKISPEQVAALQSRFPDHELVFERIDTTDWRHHLEVCQKGNYGLVILPLERPAPLAAMEEGYVHVSFDKNNIPRKLVALGPRFEVLKNK